MAKFTSETARAARALCRNTVKRTSWRPGVRHQRGERNNAAKLGWNDVAAIRYLWSDKSTNWLCERYHVSPNTIRRIRRLETWMHARNDDRPESWVLAA